MNKPIENGSGAASRHKLANPCGARVVARALKRHGVEVMFGQSLPSALYLVTAEIGIRQIAYRTENAGGSMPAATRARRTRWQW